MPSRKPHRDPTATPASSSKRRPTNPRDPASDPANEIIRDEWLRRVEAEYHSAAITQHLTLWLIQIGASPDLIDSGLATVSDELSHARLSHRVYLAAGGQKVATLRREELALARNDGEPLEHDVLRACVERFCLHETVAVPLFRELREHCVVPVARRALDRVLRDEVQHRELGWTLLGWLLDGTQGDELRSIVTRELPAMMQSVVDSYVRVGAGDEAAIGSAERAWGLMAGARYAAIAERTVERDYVPRFGRLGFDARAAFDMALRVGDPANVLASFKHEPHRQRPTAV